MSDEHLDKSTAYHSNLVGEDLSSLVAYQKVKDKNEDQWATSQKDQQIKRAFEANLETSRFIYDNSELSGRKYYGPGVVDLEVDKYLNQ